MTWFGSARGSAQSRPPRPPSSRWATCAAALWWCACSGTTDVVGVLDPALTDVVVTPAEEAFSGESEDPEAVQGRLERSAPDGEAGEYLVVAGVPLRDWPGLSVPWPLTVPLRVFFSVSSWPGRSGPPKQVERDFARKGVFTAAQRENVRFAAPTGNTAERLRELFSAAPDGPHGAMDSLVTRDRFGDEYLVVLGSSCGHPSSPHGGSCPENKDDSHAGDP